MLAVVAVLALVLYACSGSGSKKKQPVADGSSPTASQSSVPTAGGSQTAASGGASGGPSSAGASGPSGGASGASGSASASGGTNGGVNGGANSTGGTNGASGGSTSGPGCQLSLSLTSQSSAYANGVDPQFTVAVANKGTADCDVDVSPKSLVLNVYSGPDHVWSSADCATGGKDLRGIAPGGVKTVTFTWNRTRSSQGCTAGSSSAKLGMYFGVVILGPGSGANAPAAQSQAKSFELKTGS
ncbi:hypothetical protein [Catenulispora rubra]|uniref:hypothetical protein n=1 Tax=Catenulispora rubra TaxID=280293 RepID=UPI00189234E1|nr:hypothetical protein [Catenulispora rubra]